MVDFVADHMENIRDLRPLPDVKPGYLRQLIPSEAPRDPEPWDDVFRDVERAIMPGVSSQGAPQFPQKIGLLLYLGSRSAWGCAYNFNPL